MRAVVGEIGEADEAACAVIDAVGRGRALDRDDLLALLALPDGSPAAAHAVEAARAVSRRASGGLGFVHAQIGLDCLPCPQCCAFCSFSADNASSKEREPFELSCSEAAELCRLFAEGGAHLISLMSSAALPFERLLEKTAAAAEVLAGSEVVLLVNGPDMDPGQARGLRAAGARAAYHALRLGEGRITRITPERRMDTIRAIREAGLALMTGVEPVWEGNDASELADSILSVAGMRPVWAGACGLTRAAGTEMQGAAGASRERIDLVAALVRLAAGDSIPVGCSGGVVWVDAGADPRDRGKDDAREALRRDLEKAAGTLRARGWRVAEAGDLGRIVEAHMRA